MPKSRSKLRVVLGDIGLNEKSGINWEAPIVQSWGVKALPWYVLVDGTGKVTASGEEAQTTVRGWFGQ